MILTCPACATRFLVPDTAFGDKPRRVRCGKCKHEWQAEPPPPPPPIPDLPELPNVAQQSYLSMEEEKKPEIPVTPPPAAPKPVPKGSNLPAIVRDAAFIRRALIGLGILLSIALLGAAYLYVSATGYEFAAGETDAAEAAAQLSIEDVKTKYVEVAATDPMAPKAWALVVEGIIRNKSADDITLPPLVLATKDAAGAVMNLYHPDVQMKTLPGHGTTGFTYTLNEVSDKLAEVTVQFGSGASADVGEQPHHAASDHAAPEPVATPAAETPPTENHGDGGH